MAAIFARLLAIIGPATNLAGTFGIGLLRFVWARGWQIGTGSAGGAMIIGGIALFGVLTFAWFVSDWQHKATVWATERQIARKNRDLEAISQKQAEEILVRERERAELKRKLSEITKPVTITEIIEVPKEIIVQRGCTSTSFDTPDEIRQQLNRMLRK
jgi:Zn-dependent protease with chaperone function